ncbi:hypothetical protein HYS31_02930 [Candidatus Woesearchaeota archaeon]|nr:hypothetical protein [Candidatus Woesearchaeota archaeon]
MNDGNKRGIELSLNFLVVIIISITVFAFGVKFIYDLTNEANELQKLTINDLDERISGLACEGTDLVCIGIDRKTIKRSKFDVFGIKIINIKERQKFDIEVENPKENSIEFLGYDKDDNNKILKNSETPELSVRPRKRDIEIGKNEEGLIGIGVEVPSNAKSGTYILNVVIKTQQGGALYVPFQKLYVDVP